MRKKRVVYLYSLHVFNLPLIFILRYFVEVRVFKYQGFCLRFLQSDTFKEIDDFASVDSWRTVKATAFQKLKADFLFFEKESLRSTVADIGIDGSQIFLQHFFRAWEQFCFFAHLSENGPSVPVLLGTNYSLYLQKKHPELAPAVCILNWPFAWLDATYIWWTNRLTVVKTILKLFTPCRRIIKLKEYKILCTGMSAVEAPTSATSLDYSWLVRNGVVEPENILFILDQAATSPILDQTRINSITRRELASSLPLKEKLQLAFEFFLSSLSLRQDDYANFKFNFNLQNRLWFSIFKKLNPDFFIYSFSAGWPELPESCVAQSLGIKTIEWFYGTSEFGYTKDDDTFTDDNVRFSIRNADELWVWNTLTKDLIRKRSFLPSPGAIKVCGPILNGNWDFLKRATPPSPTVFRIAIFDITPMKSKIRLHYGEGPYCNAEMQNEIYATVLAIHDLLPSVEIIVKTKRSENFSVFERLPALEKLQALDSSRVHFLPANSDPYLAIKDADLVISTPYTSPSILALQLGRFGIFYDPLHLAKHTYKEAFKNLTIDKEDDLIDLIKALMDGRDEISWRFRRSDFPLTTPEQMKKVLHEALHEADRLLT